MVIRCDKGFTGSIAHLQIDAEIRWQSADAVVPTVFLNHVVAAYDILQPGEEICIRGERYRGGFPLAIADLTGAAFPGGGQGKDLPGDGGVA